MPNTREKLIEIFESAERPITVPHRMDAEQARKYVFGEMADHCIAEGVTVQKWIPVSDSPKERGCYLVTVRHWLDGKPVVREAYWNSADWLSCYKKGEEITPRVTHWMPLPEPPKGE